MRRSQKLLAVVGALVTAGGLGLAGCAGTSREIESQARFHDEQAKRAAAAGDYVVAKEEADEADRLRRKAHKQAAKEARPPRVEMGVPTETQPPSNMMSAPPFSGQRVY
jgi:hypothetical protein